MTIKNLDDKIQASASSESMINIAIADEKFKDNLKDLYFKKAASVNPKFLDEIPGENKKYILQSDNSIENKGFKLKAYLKYKNIEYAHEAYGTIANQIYTKGIAILNKNVIDEEDYQETLDSFNNLDVSKSTYINFLELDGKDYHLARDGNSFIIYEIEEIVEGESVEEIKNIVSKESINKSLYIKQKNGSLTVDENMKLRGIIDIDNIILNQDLKIHGIYLHRNEILSENSSVKVDGIAINMNGNSENNIDANYNFNNIYNYAKLIDNFIKAKIYSIQAS
ncbi:hypothetical protein [Peptoniphilus obesi]|nr:hypothetical protein [Peptoniphilus obesi]